MKKLVKQISLVSLVLALLVVFTACDLFSSEKTFSGNGYSITLDSSFVEKEYVSMTGYYESQKLVATVLKEEFSLFEGYYIGSLEEYAELIIEANGLSDIKVSKNNGIVFFEYEKTLNGKNFKYYATVHKGSDAYWLVQFGCETKNYDSLKADMEKYASSFKAD